MRCASSAQAAQAGAPARPLHHRGTAASRSPLSQPIGARAAAPPLARRRGALTVVAAETYRRDLSAQPRLIQHKNEAKAFYAFLSQVVRAGEEPGM